MSRASERDARDRAIEILRSAGARGDAAGDEYGAGPMTKAQKKSQEKHIPWTEGPKTTGQKIKRALW